jgi:hypothetical protein
VGPWSWCGVLLLGTAWGALDPARVHEADARTPWAAGTPDRAVSRLMVTTTRGPLLPAMPMKHLPPVSKARMTSSFSTLLFFGLKQHINQRVAPPLHIVRIAVGRGLADVGHCLTQLRGQGHIEIGML